MSARHILVESEEDCQNLKQAIEEGGDFAELAREHSTCPSGKSGGDLGEFGPGDMVPHVMHCQKLGPGPVVGPPDWSTGCCGFIHLTIQAYHDMPSPLPRSAFFLGCSLGHSSSLSSEGDPTGTGTDSGR